MTAPDPSPRPTLAFPAHHPEPLSDRAVVGTIAGCGCGCLAIAAVFLVGCATLGVFALRGIDLTFR